MWYNQSGKSGMSLLSLIQRQTLMPFMLQKSEHKPVLFIRLNTKSIEGPIAKTKQTSRQIVKLIRDLILE